jgi:hypothetical protein
VIQRALIVLSSERERVKSKRLGKKKLDNQERNKVEPKRLLEDGDSTLNRGPSQVVC